MMKKSLIALALSGLMATAAQAAPQENTVYAGAKAGWSSFHDGIAQVDASHYNGTAGYGINKNSPAYGAFVGYQLFNQNNIGLAAEVGYEYFGRVRGLQAKRPGATNKETFKHAAHGTVLSLKPSYEILPNLDVYTKVGVALVSNHFKTVELESKVPTRTNRTRPALLLAGGLEYAILPELAVNVEYQWLNNAGKANNEVLSAIRTNSGAKVTDYRPDIGSVNLGVSYRFNQGAPAVEPEIVSKTFTLNSDVTFAFGKSTLKPEAAATLDGIHSEITRVNNPAVNVNGYADRIGKDAANLKLSQRRAETVANYLVSKGVNPNAIMATGFGEANPVTGNTCDAVKGKKALVACLAPDRRVEVQVQGSKQVTM